MRIILSLVFVLLSFNSLAEPLDAIKNYGIYVEGKNGYEPLKPYNHEYVEFKYFDEIPFVERATNALVVVVYQKNFDPESIAFRAQYVAIKGGYDELSFDVSPMERPDFYRIAFSAPVDKNKILRVSQGWYFGKGAPAIFLANPEPQLEALLADFTHPAYAALPNLKDAIKSFPNNKKLQMLLPQWEKVATKEKDDREYKTANETWARIQKTDKLNAKLALFENVQRELGRYLQVYPQGAHAAEAKKRLAEAQKEIARLQNTL